MWFKRLLEDIGEFNQDTICLNIDNQSAICLSKNVDNHRCCKHIEMQYNFVKDKYAETN